MISSNHLGALEAGTSLGAYAIERVLGAGAFGITYKCRESGTGRPVAIKEYLPAALAIRDRESTTVRPLSESTRRDFEWGRERFTDEARLLVMLKHPNIVPALAYFESRGTAYLVMEYQAGRSLGDLIGDDDPLSESELLEILDPLLDAVEAVHWRGFMHRDIKPENIFIRHDGQPVLLDFGAARATVNPRSPGLTAVLTAGYAPYEQYQSRGEQGPWTDIYALGALMFRCLLGRKPIDAPMRVAARFRGAADPLEPDFALLRARTSGATADAIEAAMILDEERRPRSIAALRGLLRGAGPGDAPTKPLIGRHLQFAGLAAVLLMAVVGSGAWRPAATDHHETTTAVASLERASERLCLVLSELRPER